MLWFHLPITYHYENFSYEKNQTKLSILLYQIGIDDIKRWLKKRLLFYDNP